MDNKERSIRNYCIVKSNWAVWAGTEYSETVQECIIWLEKAHNLWKTRLMFIFFLRMSKILFQNVDYARTLAFIHIYTRRSRRCVTGNWFEEVSWFVFFFIHLCHENVFGSFTTAQLIRSYVFRVSVRENVFIKLRRYLRKTKIKYISALIKRNFNMWHLVQEPAQLCNKIKTSVE